MFVLSTVYVMRVVLMSECSLVEGLNQSASEHELMQ